MAYKEHRWTNPDGSRVTIFVDEAFDVARIGKDVSIGAGARIGSEAIIYENASIGRGARIGMDATIEAGASVGSEARIGRFARIGAWARIGAVARIGEYTCIGAGASIDAYARIGEGEAIPAGSIIEAQADMADTIEKRMADDSLMQRRVEDLKAENERLREQLATARKSALEEAARAVDETDYFCVPDERDAGMLDQQIDRCADAVLDLINEATND